MHFLKSCYLIVFSPPEHFNEDFLKSGSFANKLINLGIEGMVYKKILATLSCVHFTYALFIQE